jgi:drug/metabolite transporter (DMT)-like permease
VSHEADGPAASKRAEVTGSRGAGRWAAPATFVALWSAGFTFVSLGLEDSEPLTFLALRYIAVVALLGPVFAVMRPPLPRTREEWRHLILTGLVLQALYFALLYGAIGLDAPAGTAALIVSLQPILVALLAPRVAGEHVDARRWLGLALGLVGACEVIVARQGVESIPPTALLCTLAALAALTAGTLYENRFGTEQHPVTANLVQYAIALAVVAPAAALFDDLHVDWTAKLIGSLAYLVLANSLLAITLLLAMLRRGEAARVSALFFLTPPLAALIAYVILNEDLPPAAWPGMVIAAIGVALATMNSRSAQPSTR